MNKTAIITGAISPGYGIATTEKIISAGYSVIGTYVPDQDTIADLMKPSPELQLHRVDLSNRDDLAAFVQKLGKLKIDVLINAQMFFSMEKGAFFDHTAWDMSLAINLTAPNYLMHALKDQMAEGGSIITVTSTEGFIGSFGSSAYAATKAAIHNLTKTWANILGPRKIRANAVAPGWIGGVMDTDEVFNMSRKITPLRRLGTAEEIANVVCFLISESASFVNGQTIIVDGGYTGVDTISQFEFEAAK